MLQGRGRGVKGRSGHTLVCANLGAARLLALRAVPALDGSRGEPCMPIGVRPHPSMPCCLAPRTCLICAMEMRCAGLATKMREMRSRHSRDRCRLAGKEYLTDMMRCGRGVGWLVGVEGGGASTRAGAAHTRSGLQMHAGKESDCDDCLPVARQPPLTPRHRRLGHGQQAGAHLDGLAEVARVGGVLKGVCPHQHHVQRHPAGPHVCNLAVVLHRGSRAHAVHVVRRGCW